MSYQNNEHLIDETLLVTPKPRASSTVEKRNSYKKVEMKKPPLNYNLDASDESLGILSLTTEQLDNNRLEGGSLRKSSLELQKKALNLFEKTKRSGELPSQYLKPSETIKKIKNQTKNDGSTITESDLLKSISSLDSFVNSGYSLSEKQSFTTGKDDFQLENSHKTVNSKLSFMPHEVSTPKTSAISGGYSRIIGELAQKMSNSDISIRELLQDFYQSESQTQEGSISFIPAEQAAEKLQADELSWMREHGSLAFNKVSFSDKFINSDAKMSEFFLKKSEISDFLSKVSPEKKAAPFPLIDESVSETLDEMNKTDKTSLNNIDDIISLSTIEMAISSEGDPVKLISSICKKVFAEKTDNQVKYPKLEEVDDKFEDISLKDQKKIIKSKSKSVSVSECNKENESSLNTFSFNSDNQSNQSENQTKVSDIIDFEIPMKKSIPKDEGKKDIHLLQGKRQLLKGKDKTEFLQLPDAEISKTSSLSQKSFCHHKKNDEEIPTRDVGFTHTVAISSNNENFLLNCNQLEKHSSGNDINSKQGSPSCQSPTGSEHRSFSPASCSSRLSDDKDNQTLSSVRSGSSLDNLPDGKLPVESTRTELVWGWVKVGKKSTQEFILRNKSHQKVRFEASLTGSSFRILKDRSDSELLTSVPILLHPRESRVIYISFLPTSIGAAVEKLYFSPIDKNLQSQHLSKQIIWLFGYGGHAYVDIQNISKDTKGKYWLSLGNLDDRSVYTKTFELKNSGSLMAFATLKMDYRGLRKFSNVSVNPSCTVLKPNETATINISFCPSKEDYKQILNSLSEEATEIAFVNIIMGPEPVRGRIRRLKVKMNEQMGIIPDYPIVELLAAKFPGEQMPCDVVRCRESTNAMKDLLRSLAFKEVAIMVEKDPDRTLVANFPGLDASSQFLTLCQNERTATFLEIQKYNSFSVEPSKIFLIPPHKKEDSFIITTESVKPLYFEISVDDDNLLQCTPAQGTILSSQASFVSVKCDTSVLKEPQKMSKIKVYIENEVLEISVKIISVNSSTPS